MINAVWALITGALALMLFGAVAWAYLVFGRLYVGLSGNLEIVVVGIALWHVAGQITGAANSFSSAIRSAAGR